ncbi:S8 family serine peptidase [Streptomyces sp. NPDC046977]|uniref:S8 family serine peptidase n=1 Tax=Streptomyces sp. NPDC046977 TaxID=3154703 RepID=UPI0033FDEEB9
MAFTPTLRSVGGVVLAGALILAAAPVASADQTREDQWPLKAFDAASIWKVSKGKGVTVAVIDSGVNAHHVDLSGNVIEGKDFIDGGSTAPAPGDDHGTAMASIIAAHGHGPAGADGVMGLAPDAKILDIRDDGHRDGGFAESIRYAVDHGASVINVSSGGAVKTEQEADAVAYALRKNVVVVAASGNEGTEVSYPAGHPGAVAVGGVKNNGEIWEGSNSGPQVLLAAPGTSIVSAGGQANAAYRSGTGTSDSSAFVAAAAALLRAKFPDLTAGQIVNRLTRTAGLPASAKGTSLPDEHYGYGFIQPLAALTRDVPAGSTYGPLAVPESLKTGQNDGGQGATPDPSGAAPNTTGGAMSDDEQAAADRKQVIALSVIGLVGLLVLALIVFVIVRIARRNKGGGDDRPGGPGAPGGGYQQYGGPQPPQQYQPQPQQQGNPYAQNNPYGGQQQTPPPSSWGSGRQ